MNRVSDLDNGSANVFSETLLVAELSGEGGAGDEDDGVAKDFYLEDFAVFFGELLEGCPCVGGVDVEDVAEERNAWGFGDWCGHLVS